MKTTANTQPDIEGVASAWKVDINSMRATRGVTPDQCSGLAEWVVHASWSHPIWPFVSVMLIHLRDIPGMPPPFIKLPGATHEVMVFAMDPDKYPPHLDTDYPVGRFLSPGNFTGQFIADSDQAAIERIEFTIHEICAGQLNPDTDGVRGWIERFGDYCFKEEYRSAKPGTVQHALMQGGSVIVNLETGDAVHITPEPTTPPTQQ
jgi:hypothetical protein